MKTIIIFGGLGYLGRNLAENLKNDYNVFVVTRKKRDVSPFNNNIIEWDYNSIEKISNVIDRSFAVINLTGENISEKRWSSSQKNKILLSRVHATEAIIKSIKATKVKPLVFLQGSATGYYRFSCSKFNIKDAFLPEVVKKWEAVVKDADIDNVRKIIVRTGVVIDKSSIIIKRLKKLFKYYLGGHLGNGKQWYSWIHLEDEIRAIRYLIEHSNIQGTFNLTAPEPVTMKQFCKSIGQAMNRPSWLHIPGFILKLMYGQMADEIILNGIKVLPNRLIKAGFYFKYPDVNKALAEII
ncbi:MAG: TIGR01777 family oxidoreductase [Marinilabiliales bacterium]